MQEVKLDQPLLPQRKSGLKTESSNDAKRKELRKLETSLTDISRISPNVTMDQVLFSPNSAQKKLFSLNSAKLANFELKLMNALGQVTWEKIETDFINSSELVSSMLKGAKAFCFFIQIIQ